MNEPEKELKEKVIIIDNYIDDTILELLTKKNKNVEVIIVTSNHTTLLDIDVQRFNIEYPSLAVVKLNKFHDRFIIIDDKELYHCGASIKDLGKKCFGINDVEYIEKLKKKI